MVGRHNDNFNTSSSRVLQTGAHKHQRIIVLMPSRDTMATKVALSHWNLIFPPNNGVFRMLCVGMEVGEAYSQAIENILAEPNLSKWEYLLTIETDNVPPQDGVIKLCASMEKHKNLDAISGTYWTKGEGGVCQVWGDINDPVVNFRPQPPPEPGAVKECYGIGMGFALWRLKMFKDKKLRKPWFKTLASAAEGVGTQDLYAWSDFRKHGYRCAVDGDVQVGHYDSGQDIVW